MYIPFILSRILLFNNIEFAPFKQESRKHSKCKFHAKICWFFLILLLYYSSLTFDGFIQKINFIFRESFQFVSWTDPQIHQTHWKSCKGTKDQVKTGDLHHAWFYDCFIQHSISHLQCEIHAGVCRAVFDPYASFHYRTQQPEYHAHHSLDYYRSDWTDRRHSG